MVSPAGSPLAASLARLDPDVDRIDAAIGDPGPSYLRADLVAMHIGELWAVAEAQTGPSDHRTVGAMIMWRYTAIASAAAMLLARDQRVPSLAPATVWFRPYTRTQPTRLRLETGGFWCLPGDPDAMHIEARPVQTSGELHDVFVREVEALIEPAIEPIRRSTFLGAKALWGIAAARSISSLATELASRGETTSAIEAVTDVLARSDRLRQSAPSLEVVAHRGQARLGRRLGICCRAYRWTIGDHGMCTVCPLRPRDEWLALLHARWDEETPA